MPKKGTVTLYLRGTCNKWGATAYLVALPSHPVANSALFTSAYLPAAPAQEIQDKQERRNTR